MKQRHWASPWLGELPAHWRVMKVGMAGSILMGRQRAPQYEKGEHMTPYLRVANVLDGFIDYSDILEMNFEPKEQALFSLLPGDILLNEGQSRELVGRSAIYRGAPHQFCFQNTLIRFRVGDGLDPEFAQAQFTSWLNAGVFQLFCRQSTNIAHLGADRLAEIRMAIPPIEEQRTIVARIARETARLDALVDAKQRVLDLLAEKRKAIIATAVTRGLDPIVKLRDSGVPWLGEIPAHWELWKVGHLAKVGNGSTPERDKVAYWSEGSFPWLNSSVVNQQEVTSSDQFVTDAALRECHLPRLRPGTVLVAITGQGKTRGQAVVLSIEATINQHMAFVAPDPALVDAWFLRWSFYRAYDYLRSISDDAGGTKGALTCEDVAGLRIPVPPPDEQRTIVEHIARETAQLDAVRTATERTIALLKERRSALIAAAVTGQLDLTTEDGAAA